MKTAGLPPRVGRVDAVCALRACDAVLDTLSSQSHVAPSDLPWVPRDAFSRRTVHDSGVGSTVTESDLRVANLARGLFDK